LCSSSSCNFLLWAGLLFQETEKKSDGTRSHKYGGRLASIMPTVTLKCFIIVAE
jgi:hypothetical protein